MKFCITKELYVRVRIVREKLRFFRSNFFREYLRNNLRMDLLTSNLIKFRSFLVKFGNIYKLVNNVTSTEEEKMYDIFSSFGDIFIIKC